MIYTKKSISEMQESSQAPLNDDYKAPMGTNCKHYSRDTCLMHFPCCPKDHFYPCHKCHNEMMEDETLWNNKADNEKQSSTDENDIDNDDSEIKNKNDSNKQMDSVDTMESIALASSSESIKRHGSVDSKSVDSVKCTHCHVDQELSQHCTYCEKKFAFYFCNKCKLLGDSKELDPYHCDKCGVCRAYKSEYYHCDGCNLCMDKKLLNNHKCIADSQSDECAVCLQEVFSGCLVFPCGHKVHEDCALNLVMTGNSINCPVCRQPFLDLNSKKPGLVKRLWRWWNS
ncbi:E3 ubiquitin-protein ligase MIEL1 isoform X2 [Nematostella vectensis]|uniref:E3 ubiquitin-protein ligase MIEL1 isoform X2 n=1 Tax=Nematostella vectensis TaxID=45351 RepID=UPI002076EB69|nr:E3 ubiquitin-protein ligase MIEL1 isoform X2 [Nematostella vectensis]